MACFKVEVSVYPRCQASNWSVPYTGSTADITIFREKLQYHMDSTRKSPLALLEEDNGEGNAIHPMRAQPRDFKRSHHRRELLWACKATLQDSYKPLHIAEGEDRGCN